MKYNVRLLLLALTLCAMHSTVFSQVVLDEASLKCRIWEVTGPGIFTSSGSFAIPTPVSVVWLVDGKTLQIISGPGENITPELAVNKGNPLYLAWINTAQYSKVCKVSGVESTLPADQINAYLKTQLSAAIQEAARLQMMAFLEELKKANTLIQQDMINAAVQNLTKDPDFMVGLKKAIEDSRKDDKKATSAKRVKLALPK